MTDRNDALGKKPILLQALESDGSKVKVNNASFNAGVRDSVNSLWWAITLGSHENVRHTRSTLAKAYALLAAFTTGKYNDTPEFHLGRIVSLINLAASFEPIVSEEKLSEMINPESESGKCDLEVLKMIANQGIVSIAEISFVYDKSYVEARAGLKRLVLAGYIVKVRSGKAVYPQLTLSGYKTLLKHNVLSPRPNPI